jgi:hypothetical protein
MERAISDCIHGQLPACRSVTGGTARGSVLAIIVSPVKWLLLGQKVVVHVHFQTVVRFGERVLCQLSS